MSYNHVYKTIYCTYIEYALLCNVKMICERRTNAGIGLCRYAGRSWPLLSAKYKYKHVAIQRVICVLSVAVGDLQFSGSECAGAGPLQFVLRSSDTDHPSDLSVRSRGLVWILVLLLICFPMRVLRRYYASHIYIYIYYCIRERERERERERGRMSE